jgi:hypothetical protein
MEFYCRLLEFNNGPGYDRLKAKLDRLGARYTVKRLGSLPTGTMTSLEYICGERDPLFRQIERLVAENDFYVQTGVRFSERERRSADWLCARVSESQYPQPEDPFRYKQVTYDLASYCWRCGIGARQTEPFRLARDLRLKRSHFMGLHWVFDEIFVRPTVRSVFENEKITGTAYCHPVYSRSGHEIANLLQLQIEILPHAGLVTDGLVSETCQAGKPQVCPTAGRVYPADYPFCGRTKYNYPTRDAIRFRRESLVRAPDIAKSQEYLGSGGNAHRLILVSRKLADVMDRHDLPGMVLTPVLLQ